VTYLEIGHYRIHILSIIIHDQLVITCGVENASINNPRVNVTLSK
jgi:hypothetical protein